jgi:hypothetical protein
LNSYRRFLAASSQMLNQSDRQSEDQSSSTAKPSQQLWTLAACPAVDHDARPEGEASSSGRPPLSPRCIVIMAAAGGVAVTASSWPACFFISGLFVRASLAGRGPANFLANRAWRLGVPFLISIFLVTPIAYYPSFLRYHLPGTTDFNFFPFLAAHLDDRSLAVRVGVVLVGVAGARCVTSGFQPSQRRTWRIPDQARAQACPRLAHWSVSPH